MVAFDSICDSMTVVHSAVKFFGACKDIDHCFIAVLDIGEGRVVGCVKEGIFNA